MFPLVNNPALVVYAFFLILTAVFVSTAIFGWLWNITIPGIFKVRPITFWEAFRLLLIGAMLSSGAFIRFNAGG